MNRWIWGLLGLPVLQTNFPKFFSLIREGIVLPKGSFIVLYWWLGNWTGLLNIESVPSNLDIVSVTALSTFSCGSWGCRGYHVIGCTCGWLSGADCDHVCWAGMVVAVGTVVFDLVPNSPELISWFTTACTIAGSAEFGAGCVGIGVLSTSISACSAVKSAAGSEMIDGGGEPVGLTSAAGEVVPRLTTRGGVDALECLLTFLGVALIFQKKSS